VCRKTPGNVSRHLDFLCSRNWGSSAHAFDSLQAATGALPSSLPVIGSARSTSRPSPGRKCWSAIVPLPFSGMNFGFRGIGAAASPSFIPVGHGQGDIGVGGSVVEEKLALEIAQALEERGPGLILSAFLKGQLRANEGLVGSLEQFRRVIQVEQRLAAGISSSANRRVAAGVGFRILA